MNKLLLLIFLSFICLSSCKKTDVKKGEKTISSVLFSSNNNEIIYSMDSTLDGGYIIAIKEENTHTINADGVVMKTDGDGNILWRKKYGGKSADAIFSVHPTKDGGYIACGYTSSKGFATQLHNKLNDAWVLKLNAKGEVQWDTTYGGIYDDCFYDIKETPDNNFVATGYNDDSVNYYQSNVFICKIAPNGVRLWQREKRFFQNTERGLNISVNPYNGNYIIGGATTWGFPSEYNFYYTLLVEYTPLGAYRFSGEFNTESYFANYHSLYDHHLPTVKVITKPDGYLVATSVPEDDSSSKTVLIKTNKFSGNILWKKSFPLLGNTCFFDFIADADGGFALTGGTTDQYVNTTVVGYFVAKDLYLLKVDKDGNTTKINYYGGGNSATNGMGIRKRGDGSYLIAGTSTYSDFGGRKTFFLRTDKNGEIE
ncbi:MAG: hypothetical protein NTX03_03315 [Bacteroidetes bacterium]|nr:hypothetical protein [Bacteroidota bacterium]